MKNPRRKEFYLIKSLVNHIRCITKADITEEEVSISKEKKVCLVCKNKLAGFNIFLCPDCGALYCESCAMALIELENACWYCNNPMDPSQPIKLTEGNVDEIRAEKPIIIENVK